MSGRSCKHEDIQNEPSNNQYRKSFQRLPEERLAAACTPHGNSKKALADGLKPGEASTFPAPLALPDDLLILDPEEASEHQSLRSWMRLEERNEVTPERNKLYLLRPPTVDNSVKFVQEWCDPVRKIKGGSTAAAVPETSSASRDGLWKGVLDYLSAFYHGMPVELYEGPRMSFVRHQGRSAGGTKKKSSSSSSISSKTPDRIDMAFGDGLLLDVRTRACPDGTFARQLNLNDLIDVLINMLPADAYAVMMLVDHDVYEDDDDTFVCGRAYGGSRVSVVSTARYNPALDESIGLDVEHAWPASHCRDFMRRCEQAAGDGGEEEEEQQQQRPAKKARKAGKPGARHGTDGKGGVNDNEKDPGPLRLAVSAYRDTWARAGRSATGDAEGATAATTTAVLARRWLARVCKTASHELGHCFGMDHCSYYACIMQGTADLHEDARQPAYLCPVDRAKVLHATGADREARYRTLLRLCRRKEWRDDPMFAAYAAWIEAVMKKDAQKGTASGEVILID